MLGYRLVSTLALCAAAAAAEGAANTVSADSLAKVLAGVTFLKEMGNFDNAKHAMSLFSKVADAHVAEARPLSKKSLSVYIAVAVLCAS